VVVKALLNKNMPISRAIQTIVEQTKLLACRYDAEINCQRRTTPWILDGAAFATVKQKLMHYTLELTIPEWSATKRMADEIKARDAKEFDFDPDKGCTFGCELPARFGLPCKHWMYASIVEECPLPLLLFHPCWLFDGLAVLHKRWFMSWDLEHQPALGPSLADRYAGD